LPRIYSYLNSLSFKSNPGAPPEIELMKTHYPFFGRNQPIHM